MFLQLLGFLVCIATSDSHGEWDYRTGEKTGPNYWKVAYPTCGSTVRQSPININPVKIKTASNINTIKTNYQKLPANISTYEVVNNGHSIQMNLPADAKYYAKKNQMFYKLSQMHIHFDTYESKEGSEHTYNDKSFPVEIHLVHTNTKYKAKVASKYSDGLLVIGVFAQLGRKSSWITKTFASAAKKIQRPGESVHIAAFSPAVLIPPAQSGRSNYDYVNYSGSLTTPPCSETVDWIVFTRSTLTISRIHLDKLAKAKNHLLTSLSGNHRPIQPISGRSVYGVKIKY